MNKKRVILKILVASEHPFSYSLALFLPSRILLVTTLHDISIWNRE